MSGIIWVRLLLYLGWFRVGMGAVLRVILYSTLKIL